VLQLQHNFYRAILWVLHQGNSPTTSGSRCIWLVQERTWDLWLCKGRPQTSPLCADKERIEQEGANMKPANGESRHTGMKTTSSSCILMAEGHFWPLT
jgi:hypothetical protein